MKKLRIVLPIDPVDHDAFKQAAKDAGLPLVAWIRHTCLGSLQNEPACPEPNLPPVSRPEPVLESQTPPLRFKTSPHCSGRCQRIGAPSCDPCRKAKPV